MTDSLSKYLSAWDGKRLRVVTTLGEFQGEVREAGDWLTLMDSQGEESALILRGHVVAIGLMDAEFEAHPELEAFIDEVEDVPGMGVFAKAVGHC